MATIQQLHCGLNVSSNSTPQNFQIPQAYSENESMQPLSAPGSPTNLSPTKMFKSQGARQTLSPSSSYNPLMPLRLKSENNENQSTGLFDVLSNEDYIISQSAKKNSNNGNLKKLVDEFKSEKRSLSAEKTYKGASTVSRSIGLWAKENMPDSSEKNALGFKKKQRSSTEQVNRSVGGEAIARFENRKVKSNRLDLDSDLEINGRYNTEEGIEGLFDEEYYENIRESGPIRYSKMSEEDAATIFEIRRKELLSFLTKLGASSAVSKKKFVNKNALASRLSGQGSDIGKNDFHREKGIKRLQDSLKENSSPTHFIIYNTTSDSMWNNATNPQANKFATPSRDKKVANSVKAGCESAPGDKRMSSAKQLRERGDLSPQVERNLEASFNQLLEWSDTGEKRSPVKVVKKVESTPKVSEEKGDAIESITINLAKTKLNKKKKKKAKKAKNEGEAICERVVIVKQLSEGVRGSPVWEQSEEQPMESKANQNDLAVIKKKNQNVMNEIAEIDSQIERMKESDNKTLTFRRYEEEDREFRTREEPRRPLYSEQEGYSLAAKMKKSAERSRSLSLKLAVRENFKHNESMQENYNRGGLKNKENNHEEETGDQSRRNQKVRFASDMAESNKNSSSQPIQKETKEKTLVRVPSQTNTLKVDLNKQNRGQTQKRALSNNINVARNMQQERNSSLSTLASPKVNSKDLKLKNLDLNKGNNDVNQSFNLNTSQTATNKTAEKKKPVTEVNGSRVKENQQPMQQLKSKKIISRTSETASTLQTVREHLLTSPKELAFSLRKTPVSNPTLKPEIPVVKKSLSNCSSANKALLNYRKPANKSISLKSSQKSVSDKDYKDYSIDGIQIPNLFESQSSANFHEPTPSVPKIPFSKDTKITKEIPKEEKPVAPTTTVKPKPSKSKEPTKVIRDVQLKVKKVEANRPDFDLNSSTNLRAKILGQVRPIPENLSFLKASLSPSSNSDSSKLDMKTFGLEDFGISPVGNLPSKKSEAIDKSLLRKGSLSTPRGFRVVASPAIVSNRGCVALSLQDLREKLAEKACVETEEDNASLDSFRLREKSLNLPLHPSQVGNQGQNVKDQETSKDSQTLKRKKGAGYSVC